MKLISKIFAGLFVFITLTVGAQETIKKEAKKFPPPKILKNNNALSDFKQRNKDVKTVHWKEGKVIIIEKQDGSVERYRLNDKGEEQKAENLYGTLPMPPPPPPPVVRKVTFPPPPPPSINKKQ